MEKLSSEKLSGLGIQKWQLHLPAAAYIQQQALIGEFAIGAGFAQVVENLYAGGREVVGIFSPEGQIKV